MTTVPDPIDRHARQLHAQAVAHLSPRTLARLRDARRAAAGAPPRRLPQFAPWLAGSAVAATLALAVVLIPGTPVPAPGPSVAGAGEAPRAARYAALDDAVQPLQEDPGFYLWLDSADASALAME